MIKQFELPAEQKKADTYISKNVGCHVWVDGNRIVVYTGTDISLEPEVIEQ